MRAHEHEESKAEREMGSAILDGEDRPVLSGCLKSLAGSIQSPSLALTFTCDLIGESRWGYVTMEIFERVGTSSLSLAPELRCVG
jgi:hypothetical protein